MLLHEALWARVCEAKATRDMYDEAVREATASFNAGERTQFPDYLVQCALSAGEDYDAARRAYLDVLPFARCES